MRFGSPEAGIKRECWLRGTRLRRPRPTRPSRADEGASRREAKGLAKPADRSAIGCVKQWFYSEDGEQKGPVPEETLREMHRTGKLRDDSLVWTDGMAEWRGIATLPGWDESPYESPPSAQVEEAVPVNWDGYEAAGSQVRPWVRYWARTVDMLVAMVVVATGAGLVVRQVGEDYEALFGFAILLSTLLVEPLWFAMIGTTPGKALFHIRVRNRDGTRLSFSRAFGRRLSVLIRGEGLGIPILSLVTHIMAYSRLSNHGVTSWDEASGFVVTHRPVDWWRWLVFLGLFVLLVSLMALGSEV